MKKENKKQDLISSIQQKKNEKEKKEVKLLFIL
jgi:hypothetical protein